MRRELRKRDEIANSIDGDGVHCHGTALVIEFQRLEQAQVGMSSSNDIATTRARPTSITIGPRTLAQQGPREMQREDALADPPPASEQEGVRPALSIGE